MISWPVWDSYFHWRSWQRWGHTQANQTPTLSTLFHCPHWWWSFWCKSALHIMSDNKEHIISCVQTHHNGIMLFRQLWASPKHMHLDGRWHGIKNATFNTSPHRGSKGTENWPLENTREPKSSCQPIQSKRNPFAKSFTWGFSLEPTDHFTFQAPLPILPTPTKKEK